MIGRGKNQRHKLLQRGTLTSPFNVCSCPQCHYSVPHKRGIPCFTLICPECNIPLIRQDPSESKNIQQVPVENAKISNFPIIDTELCIGCGTCVDKCPSEAILLVEGKAKITIANCKKCRICVNSCPVGAIT